MPKHEHDPEKCRICAEHGSWATTGDKVGWLDAHHDAGYEFRLEDGRAVELLAPVSR